jgi:predicted DNA-binding transcriptional regulator YafY
MSNEQMNARLGNIIKLIANNPGITLTKLHEALCRSGFAVSERTLAKDILVLKEQYQLLDDKPRLRNGYLLQDMFTLSSIDAVLVLDMMHIFGVRLDDPDAIQLAKRLLPWLDESQADARTARKRAPARSFRQRNIYGKNAGSQRAQEQLLEAIRARLPVALTYATPRAQRPKSIRGYPLLLVFHERGWYCLMRDLSERQYAPRRVDRIQSINIMQSMPVNERHAEDTAEAEFLMSCGWGMTFPQTLAELKEADAGEPIVVRFDRTVAPFILESTERHPRALIRSAQDGTGDAILKIHLSNSKEFMYWVRSFGCHAWVLAPRHLAESESAEVRRMSERYASQ